MNIETQNPNITMVGGVSTHAMLNLLYAAEFGANVALGKAKADFKAGILTKPDYKKFKKDLKAALRVVEQLTPVLKAANDEAEDE